jgi:type II secretory pathway predicted ATPase ExeA
VKSSLPRNNDGAMNRAIDYTTYWGLRTFPFDNVPDPRFYVPCSQHDAAHRWLSYGIQTRKGILLLTSDIGCGKTLLSRRLIVALSPARYDVALVANPALSPSELLDEVLSQFGLGLVESKAARLQRLNERQELNAQRGISSVLVVDEAQAIESGKGFEELRLLTNFQLNDRFLLTIVLIGQPELRHRVAEIPQLNQRIAARIWARSRQRKRQPTSRHVWERRHNGQTCLRKKRWRPSTNRAKESGGSSTHSVISVSLPERSIMCRRSMIDLFRESSKSYDRWSHLLRG